MTPRGPNEDMERRANPRHQVTCRVELMFGSSCGGKSSVTDLSVGGCFVKCAEAVRVGDVVKLLFRVHGAGDLTVWGDVTHAGRNGFGLRFTAFSHGGAPEILAVIMADGRRR